MWIVAKIKKKELNIFKEKLNKKFGKAIEFYHPKIEYHKWHKNKLKKIEKLVLDNYVFCNHENFNKLNYISEVKFIRGLEYFLKGHETNQKEIIKFIKHCKAFENSNGYLKPDFFSSMIRKKAKFLSGPFTNLMFEIIEKEKNRLKILVGGLVTIISDSKNYLYRPI